MRRRYPPPITLRLEVASCISKLSWFYHKHHWKGDGNPGGQLQLTLEDVPRPRGRAPAGKRWSTRLGDWEATAVAVEEENEEAAQDLGEPDVIVSAPTDVVRRVYASYDAARIQEATRRRAAAAEERRREGEECGKVVDGAMNTLSVTYLREMRGGPSSGGT